MLHIPQSVSQLSQPLALHGSLLQVWKLRQDALAHSCPFPGSTACSQHPPWHSKLRFPFLPWRGQQSACAECFNGEPCFLLASVCFEPAPNFLQPGSGLGKHSRGSLWHREAELSPTAFCLGVYCSLFPDLYFFSCNLAWFPAIFPMPGRHSMIFHTSWSGRRQAGSWEPSSLSRSWRWQALASTMVLASPGCQQELCSPCRLCTKVWGC